jgi:hypothetical protein
LKNQNAQQQVYDVVAQQQVHDVVNVDLIFKISVFQKSWKIQLVSKLRLFTILKKQVGNRTL